MVQPLPTWEQELNISCLLSSGCWGQICPNDQTRALPWDKGQSCGFGVQRSLQKAVQAAFADGRGCEGPGTTCSPQVNSPPQAEHTFIAQTWHTACMGTHTTVVTTRLLIPDSSLGVLEKLHCGILLLAGEHQAHPRLLARMELWKGAQP